MRKITGAVLGYAALLLGIVVPILTLGGVSLMIWDCHVLCGPPSREDVKLFAILYMSITLPIGIYLALCFISFPIFAFFGVRVPKHNRTQTVALAGSMKALALR